ncbi:MAG TPA: hypothetical protein DCS93_18600 [Microscillaceae bacterium]|nr:hypothetical protein [Microscillaceae bacterium]
MTIHFNFWVLIFLMACFQGLFLSTSLLFIKPQEYINKRVLSVLLLVFSVILLEELIQEAGLYPSFPHFIKVSTLLPFLFGPLLYLYFIYLSSSPPQKFTFKHWLHFLPFGIALLWHLPFYISSGGYKLASFQISTELLAWIYLKFSHIIIYIILITSKLLALRSSNQLNPKQQWFAIGFSVFALGTVATYLLFSLYWFEVSWWRYADQLGGLVMVVTVFALSFVAVKNNEELTAQWARVIEQVKTPRYQNSTLTSSDKQTYLQKLHQLLQTQKPFLDPKLNLAALAHMLHIKPHLLSQIMNEMTGKNFYELMNQYRVEEVKQKLKDPNQQNKTLLAIAFESGFNNKTSFNQAFKEFTGVTPSVFRKSIAS